MGSDKKIIINVGRQVGSGGRIIAKLLADEFGCQFYDKEILNLAAKESGFSEKFFEQNDEHKGFFQTLFHTHAPLLSIFITADMKDRIRLVCERQKCDEEAARKLIINKESDRSSYYNYYTGKKWGHSSSYDLCVNSSIMGLEKTADIIGCFIRRRFELDNTEKGRKP